MENNPRCVLLFSGKRKSGKDYFTDKLLQMTDGSDIALIKISAPIKSHFAKTFNLDEKELMASGPYKENYRKEMILWSENLRTKDPAVFITSAIQMQNAYSKPIWIVSDVRRNTDIEWFKQTFQQKVKTIRIQASDEVRISRGWTFVPGIDDAASECDLDNYIQWDWHITNDGDSQVVSQSLTMILKFILSQLEHTS